MKGIKFHLWLIVVASCSVGPQPSEAGVSLEEKLLATAPGDLEVGPCQFSPDGKRVAYIARKGGQAFVMVGDKKGPEWDFIEGLSFSPSGRTLAYKANRGGKFNESNRSVEGGIWSVVVEDRRGDLLDNAYHGAAVWAPDRMAVDYAPFQFSPDEKSVAYIARRNHRSFVVAGDQRGPGYDSIGIGSIVFSSDGKTVAYSAKRGVKEFVVVGEQEGEAFDGVGPPVFSPDGKLVAYEARDLHSFVVVGDRKGEEFDGVGRPVFSPDGTVAYQARKGLESFIVVGGNNRKPFNYVWEPVFSRDGKRLAYKANVDGFPEVFSGIVGGKWHVVIGEECGPPFDDILQNPVFSPDGSTVAYPALKDGKWFMIVGERKGEGFDFVTPPTFSPDGKKVAYKANVGGKRDDHAVEGGKWIMVVGDRKGESYDWVGAPVFSPDGRTVAHVANMGGKKEAWNHRQKDIRGGRWFLIVGEKRSEEFDHLSDPAFSPDGRRIAFGAVRGRELWWKVALVE